MHHGQGKIVFHASFAHFSTTNNSSNFASINKSKLANLLLVASIVKALSRTGGTRNLDGDSIVLSESLVIQVLSRNSLDAFKKLDFFRWCSLRPNYKHSLKTYSQIFRTVCLHHHPSLEEIFGLLTSMKQDNIVLDSSILKLLLDAFIKSGKFDSALELLDHMEGELTTGTASNCFNYDLYNSVLIALVRKGELNLGLSIFSKILDTSDVSDNINGTGYGDVHRDGPFPNAITCNELLVALRKSDMRKEFKQVLNKLREKKLFPLDAWGYNICIHAFGCWGDLATSLSLFKEMKKRSLGGSFSPDLCTYNSLIQVLCLAGKVKDALIIWEELKGSVHHPDAFTYRILVQGCAKSYRIDEAMKVFGEMQYNGFRPGTVIYNSLLDGLFKARKLTEACHLFEQMIEDGVKTSCWTYNILINGLFRNDRSVAGYTLFCDLKKKGQFVDGVTYSIIILYLCREGQIEKALKLLEEMEARGFVVDLVTVTSLLIALHRLGRWDWTERLMKHIRDANLVLNVLEWKSTMEDSIKNLRSKRKDFTPMFPFTGESDEIISLLSWVGKEINPMATSKDGRAQCENMSSSEADQWSSSPYMDQLADEVSLYNCTKLFSVNVGKRVMSKGLNSFDIDMVNTYLSIFLANGKISLACKLFEIFTDMGVEPVSYTYNSFMSSFVKKGYFNEAGAVLHAMGEKVCPADIATYNVIIQGLGKMGRADLASAVLDNLMKKGGFLDIVMYNTLINALGKAGRLDEANALFDQMKASGINPDVVTYNTLIEIHSKAGQLKDAYKFLKMMLDAGCSPNHVTDTTLDFLEKEIEKLRYQKASIRQAHTNGSM